LVLLQLASCEIVENTTNTILQLATKRSFVRVTIDRTMCQCVSVPALYAAPKAWNRLPTKLKTSTRYTDSFKRSLKTFLFQSAYGCETC